MTTVIDKEKEKGLNGHHAGGVERAPLRASG